MNGPALQGQDGRGFCCFAMRDDGPDIASVDQQQPIRAYHPLCFYPQGELTPASFGHVSDIHLNSRQQILARTPARVIDDPRAAKDSPPIGGLVNVYSRSFHAVLDALGSNSRMDVLLAGGDYMDHAYNCYPYQQGQDTSQLSSPKASKVWELMDVRKGHGFEKNYQKFIDLICLFGELRWFYQKFSKPIFAVTGNHDCYQEAYGISPRVFHFKRANEGIPADHNLTFYEAILAFGESYGHLQKMGSSFAPELFEWFYTVLTPFSDFTVELPSQHVVGIGWGEDEECISVPGSMGQGLGHLPRAEETLSNAQLSLFKLEPRNGKKRVLLTHFTFVSYAEHIADVDAQQANAHKVSCSDSWQWSPYSDHDMGTFEKQRSVMYAAVSDPKKTQFAISGHSHRKGVYFLGDRSGDSYPTTMNSPRTPLQLADLANAKGRTPIVVSDSAGPTPRLNISHEFGPQGSDRPAGSLVLVSTSGAVERVEAVPVPSTAANGHQAKPRLAVALDFRHVHENEVFDEESRRRPSRAVRQSNSPMC
ncbi:MAG: metallophosphoesterase [Polyangiaceae bacterium]